MLELAPVQELAPVMVRVLVQELAQERVRVLGCRLMSQYQSLCYQYRLGLTTPVQEQELAQVQELELEL